MPITYALNMFGLSFASLSALLVWVVLEHRHVMVRALKRAPYLFEDYFSAGMKDKKDSEPGCRDVPAWWYLACWPLALFTAIFAVEYWEVELRWYGVLLACAVALVFYPPVSSCLRTSRSMLTVRTRATAEHCIRNVQSEDQHRCLLPHRCRPCIRGKGLGEYMVL